MQNIGIAVTGKEAKLQPTFGGSASLVCNNKGDTITFTFDADWEAQNTKTARFVYVREGEVKHQDVVFQGTTVEIPALSNTREVRVGVFAGDLITTTPAVIPCKPSILCGTGSPEDPTPSQYDQIMALLNAGTGGTGTGGSVTVDEELDEESTNPVQNATITAKIAELSEGLLNTGAKAFTAIKIDRENFLQAINNQAFGGLVGATAYATQRHFIPTESVDPNYKVGHLYEIVRHGEAGSYTYTIEDRTQCIPTHLYNFVEIENGEAYEVSRCLMDNYSFGDPNANIPLTRVALLASAYHTHTADEIDGLDGTNGSTASEELRQLCGIVSGVGDRLMLSKTIPNRPGELGYLYSHHYRYVLYTGEDTGDYHKYDIYEIVWTSTSLTTDEYSLELYSRFDLAHAHSMKVSEALTDTKAGDLRQGALTADKMAWLDVSDATYTTTPIYNGERRYGTVLLDGTFDPECADRECTAYLDVRNHRRLRITFTEFTPSSSSVDRTLYLAEYDADKKFIAGSIRALVMRPLDASGNIQDTTECTSDLNMINTNATYSHGMGEYFYRSNGTAYVVIFNMYRPDSADFHTDGEDIASATYTIPESMLPADISNGGASGGSNEEISFGNYTKSILAEHGTVVGYYNTAGTLVDDSRAITTNKIPCTVDETFVITAKVVAGKLVNYFDAAGNFIESDGSITNVTDYAYQSLHDGYITFTYFDTNTGGSAWLNVSKVCDIGLIEKLEDGLPNVIRERHYSFNTENNNFSANFIYKLANTFEQGTIKRIELKTLATDTAPSLKLLIYDETLKLLNIHELQATNDAGAVSCLCDIPIPSNSYIAICPSVGLRAGSTSTDKAQRLTQVGIGQTATIKSTYDYALWHDITFEYSTPAEENFKSLELPLQGKRWVVVGDSITEANFRTTMHYHDYIAERTGITVFNYGRGGTGFGNGVNNNAAYYQRVANITEDNLDLITIFGSPNDCMGAVPIGTKDDTLTAATIGGYMNETLRVLFTRHPTVRIALITPFPYYGHTIGDTNDYMERYVTLMKEVANKWGYPILDLYHNSGIDANSQSHIAAFFSDTGVHPNEAGHLYVAPLIKDFISRLIHI